MIEAKADEKIFANNTITLFGEIDEGMTEKVLKQLLTLQFKFREECTVDPTVVVFIHSPGGIVTGGMAIYDALKALKCRVVCVCMGRAASLSAILLSAGDPGYRYALENAEIMIHQPLGGAQGQATDIEIRCAQMLKIKKKLNEILAQNTGQAIEQIESDTERDLYMSAAQAKEYGLIDKVLDDFSEVYGEISYP